MSAKLCYECAASFWVMMFVAQCLSRYDYIKQSIRQQSKLSQIASGRTVGLLIKKVIRACYLKCHCHSYPDLEDYYSQNETFIRVVLYFEFISKAMLCYPSICMLEQAHKLIKACWAVVRSYF